MHVPVLLLRVLLRWVVDPCMAGSTQNKAIIMRNMTIVLDNECIDCIPFAINLRLRG